MPVCCELAAYDNYLGNIVSVLLLLLLICYIGVFSETTVLKSLSSMLIEQLQQALKEGLYQQYL